MLNFFQKRKQDLFNCSLLKVDMHSHLLPGFDDGPIELETSIKLIAGLKEFGYSKLITTPHIRGDMYRNTSDAIKSKLEIAQRELQKRKIEIELHAAAEYFLDDYFAELLKKKQPLLTIKNNIVLVEFSVMQMFRNIKEILFDVQMAGYQPVLAHPERYTYLYNKYDIFHTFKENGCLFQLNLLSLSGRYEKTVKKMAGYFIQHDFYDMAGTDIHNHAHLQHLRTLSIDIELQTLINRRFLNRYL